MDSIYENDFRNELIQNHPISLQSFVSSPLPQGWQYLEVEQLKKDEKVNKKVEIYRALRFWKFQRVGEDEGKG